MEGKTQDQGKKIEKRKQDREKSNWRGGGTKKKTIEEKKAIMNNKDK